MYFLLLAAVLLVISAAVFAGKKKRQFRLSVDCSRPDHRCKCGEPVEFCITSNRKVPVRVQISIDGGNVLRTEEILPPAKVTASLDQPGFLLCTASAGKVVTHCAAGVEPENIHPYAAKPADFDTFWDQAIEEFNTVPPDLKMTRCDTFKGQDIYLLDCANVNGNRAYAMLAIPRKRAGKVPLVVRFEGGEAYINHRYFKHAVDWFRKELGRPCAALIFHLPPYPPEENKKAAVKRHKEFLQEIGLRRYILVGMDSPEKFYGYTALAGCLRLLKAAAERPEIDKDNILYTGASHGGTFGLYLAACSGLLKAAFCGVPSFCDMGGAPGGRRNISTREFLEHMDTISYFDCAYFADRIKIPIFCSVGFVDRSCPPSGVYAMYNQLDCPKVMYDKIHNGHGDAPADYEQTWWNWLKNHLDKV